MATTSTVVSGLLTFTLEEIKKQKAETKILIEKSIENKKLDSIVRINKLQFDKIFNEYTDGSAYRKLKENSPKVLSKFFMPNSPSDSLKASIEEINSKNLDDDVKEIQIANLIKEFMDFKINRERCDFCVYLIKNMTTLIGFSKILELERLHKATPSPVA